MHSASLLILKMGGNVSAMDNTSNFLENKIHKISAVTHSEQILLLSDYYLMIFILYRVGKSVKRNSYESNGC
jgi:hypothetical protein